MEMILSLEMKEIDGFRWAMTTLMHKMASHIIAGQIGMNCDREECFLLDMLMPFLKLNFAGNN